MTASIAVKAMLTDITPNRLEAWVLEAYKGKQTGGWVLEPYKGKQAVGLGTNGYWRLIKVNRL